MIHLTLTRIKDTGRETLGELRVEGHNDIPVFHTIERPWLNNKPGVSCIPKGTYKFVPHGWHPKTKYKRKRVWRLLDVTGRSAILIHVANKVEDIIGCIGPGLKAGKINGHPAVLESEAANGDQNSGAMDILRRIIGENEGTITIL